MDKMVRCPDRITCRYGGCNQHGDDHLLNDDCGAFDLNCPACVPIPSANPEPKCTCVTLTATNSIINMGKNGWTFALCPVHPSPAKPEPKYRTVPCPDGIDGCLVVHQVEIKPKPAEPENPRLLTPMEQTRALMDIPFADLRGQLSRDTLCKAQDAKSFEAGKASRKLPSVEEIAEVINDYILHKVSHLLTQAQIQELASAILAL